MRRGIAELADGHQPISVPGHPFQNVIYPVKLFSSFFQPPSETPRVALVHIPTSIQPYKSLRHQTGWPLLLSHYLPDPRLPTHSTRAPTRPNPHPHPTTPPPVPPHPTKLPRPTPPSPTSPRTEQFVGNRVKRVRRVRPLSSIHPSRNVRVIVRLMRSRSRAVERERGLGLGLGLGGRCPLRLGITGYRLLRHQGGMSPLLVSFGDPSLSDRGKLGRMRELRADTFLE